MDLFKIPDKYGKKTWCLNIYSKYCMQNEPMIMYCIYSNKISPDLPALKSTRCDDVSFIEKNISNFWLKKKCLVYIYFVITLRIGTEKPKQTV